MGKAARCIEIFYCQTDKNLNRSTCFVRRISLQGECKAGDKYFANQLITHKNKRKSSFKKVARTSRNHKSGF